jgi:hypothetical protein
MNSFSENVLSYITYVSVWVIDSRLRGIYRAMQNHYYDKADYLIRDILDVIYNAAEVDIESIMLHTIMCNLHMALVELELKRYEQAHNIIRDLHYYVSYE